MIQQPLLDHQAGAKHHTLTSLLFDERIETVCYAADLREVYDTERRILYVACTRARDQIL